METKTIENSHSAATLEQTLAVQATKDSLSNNGNNAKETLIKKRLNNQPTNLARI